MLLNTRSVALTAAAAFAALTLTSASAQHGSADTAGHHKMAAQMQATQKKLDDLVAKMQAAKGDAKVDQIAAIVTELVASHRQMHAHMASHHAEPAPAPAGTPPPGAAPPAPGGHVHE